MPEATTDVLQTEMEGAGGMCAMDGSCGETAGGGGGVIGGCGVGLGVGTGCVVQLLGKKV